MRKSQRAKRPSVAASEADRDSREKRPKTAHSVEIQTESVEIQTEPVAATTHIEAGTQRAESDSRGIGNRGNAMVDFVDLSIESNDNDILAETHVSPLASIHSALGLHVSHAIKNKIVSGQYIDLAQLLAVQPGSQEASKRIEINGSGELVIKQTQTARAIASIEIWTDAFLIYMAIFLAGHPHRLQEMLKYMDTVRTVASRHQGFGWKAYDQQFRLRLAADPAGISFATIDTELWLLYVGSQPRQVAPVLTNVRRCYDFNYGNCVRRQCQYKHSCMHCNALHPSRWCPNGSMQGVSRSGPVRASVSQGQMLGQTSTRPAFRPRSSFRTRPRF